MSDTADIPIAEGFDATVAMLPTGAISVWQLEAHEANNALTRYRRGDRKPYMLPHGASWFLRSHVAAAACMRFDDHLNVSGEVVDVARKMMPWLASHDLVTTFGGGATYRFWKTSLYEPVPEGTYLLGCWYVWAPRYSHTVTFAWRVLSEGPAQGRIVHQSLPLDVTDGRPDPGCWRVVKSLLKVLDIYERDYPDFPGFNTGRALGRRILADVSVQAYSEEDTGVIIPRETISNERIA